MVTATAGHLVEKTYPPERVGRSDPRGALGGQRVDRPICTRDASSTGDPFVRRRPRRRHRRGRRDQLVGDPHRDLPARPFHEFVRQRALPPARPPPAGREPRARRRHVHVSCTPRCGIQNHAGVFVFDITRSDDLPKRGWTSSCGRPIRRMPVRFSRAFRRRLGGG